MTSRNASGRRVYDATTDATRKAAAWIEFITIMVGLITIVPHSTMAE